MTTAQAIISNRTRLPKREFTDEMRLAILNRIETQRRNGTTLRSACANENIRQNYYYNWKARFKIKSRSSDSVRSNPSVPYFDAQSAFSLFLSQAKPGSFFTYIKE